MTMKADPNFCPLPIRAAIDRFVRDRLRPGGFVNAILENDLLEAINRADSANLFLIPHIVAYMAEHVPASARGSEAWVNDWLQGLT